MAVLNPTPFFVLNKHVWINSEVRIKPLVVVLFLHVKWLRKIESFTTMRLHILISTGMLNLLDQNIIIRQLNRTKELKNCFLTFAKVSIIISIVCSLLVRSWFIKCFRLQKCVSGHIESLIVKCYLQLTSFQSIPNHLCSVTALEASCMYAHNTANSCSTPKMSWSFVGALTVVLLTTHK